MKAKNPKIDSLYNTVKKFQKTKEAERLALEDPNPIFNGSNFKLELGPMQEIGKTILPNILPNSIDMIFTDPPYSEESIPLYGESAKLARRVLKQEGVCLQS